jgi:Family of unknown function (DUF5715)
MERPGPYRLRPSHQVAIVLVLAVIATYALWARGDRAVPAAQNPPVAALAPSAPPPAPVAEPATTVPAVVEAPPATEEPSPAASVSTEPYDVAHARVQENRGGGMGLAARVQVPPELKHYSDRRRFLAIQMADSREEQYELPQDEADLAAMLRAGKLVELPALGPDHILYDIGLDAADNPMAAYDPEAHKDVPLFASAAALDAERAALAGKAQSGSGRERAAAETRGQLLATYYDDPARRATLLGKGAAVAALAANFGGRSYDLGDPSDRARFDTRLLSTTRPAARDLLLDIAREYHQKFGRLLPVTSLARTERYQRRLGRVNANATHVETPPHTTGCAFDISYRYMAADEQQFLLDRIAQLEDDGKVESLRERRNHIHVFVFQDGRRPPDELVAQFLDDVDASHGIFHLGKRGVRGVRAR